MNQIFLNHKRLNRLIESVIKRLRNFVAQVDKKSPNWQKKPKYKAFIEAQNGYIL